jgi:hypothetical protein
MHLSNLNQIQNQYGFGRRRCHHHWKCHSWRYHHKNPHLQERTEVLDQWTCTTIRGKIMKQPQVCITEDACFSLTEGKHGTRDGQPLATIATWDTRWPASSNNSNSKNQNWEALFQHLHICPPRSATMTTTSLGEKASPMYLDKYFFLLLFLVCYIYIYYKKDE